MHRGDLDVFVTYVTPKLASGKLDTYFPFTRSREEVSGRLTTANAEDVLDGLCSCIGPAGMLAST